MIANFDQARVELDRAIFLRIVDGAGTIVTCLDGCLWVTLDGCPRDTVLAPGESYLVEGATRVIVSAFGPSVARATSTRSDATARLVPAWLESSFRRIEREFAKAQALGDAPGVGTETAPGGSTFLRPRAFTPASSRRRGC